MYKILAGILHTGQINFSEAEQTHTMDKSTISNQKTMSVGKMSGGRREEEENGGGGRTRPDLQILYIQHVTKMSCLYNKTVKERSKKGNGKSRGRTDPYYGYR